MFENIAKWFSGDNRYDSGNLAKTGYAPYDAAGDFGEEIGSYEEESSKEIEVKEKSSIKLLRLTSAIDREKLIDTLKNGSAVVFDMAAIDRSDWSRVIDYVRGAVFMVDGTVTRCSEEIFIVAPPNFDVLTDA